jgi:hypothetical protein
MITSVRTTGIGPLTPTLQFWCISVECAVLVVVSPRLEVD